MSIEKNLAEYIKKREIKLSEISRGTEIPYMYLYNSLFNKNRTREMKAKEILAVCIFINVDPRDLIEKKKAQRNKKTDGSAFSTR